MGTQSSQKAPVYDLLVLFFVALVAVGGIVVVTDWLLGGLAMNREISYGMLPKEILLEAYGFTTRTDDSGDELPRSSQFGLMKSCLPETDGSHGDNIENYFSCDALRPGTTTIAGPGASQPPSCDPISILSYVSRAAPFTDPSSEFLLYASGSGAGEFLTSRLNAAREMPEEQFTAKYGSSVKYFSDGYLRYRVHTSYLNCNDYSIIKLVIQK